MAGRSHRAWWLAVAIVTIVAAVARFHQLGTESLWLDEGVSWAMTLKGPWQILEATAQNDLHPPLYYLLLDAWVAIAGTSEEALRMPSLLASLATLPVVYLIGREVFDEITGLLASALVALAEFHVLYAQEARMYAIVGLLAAISTLFYHRLVRDGPDRRTTVAYIASTLLLVYTHLLAWAVVAAHGLHWLASQGLPSGNRWPIRSWAKTQARLVVAFVPWLIPLVRQVTRVSSGFWVTDPELSDLWGTVEAFSGTAKLAVLLGTVALVGLLHRQRARPGDRLTWWDRHGLLLVWLVLPAGLLFTASELIQPIYVDKYLIGSSPAFFILVARGATCIDQRPVQVALAATLVVASGVNLQGMYDDHTKEEWREAADRVQTDAQPGDVVLFEAPFVQMPFMYYVDQPLDMRGYQDSHWLIDDQPSVTDVEQLDADRVWVVFSHTGDRGEVRDALDDAWDRSDRWTYQGLSVELWRR